MGFPELFACPKPTVVRGQRGRHCGGLFFVLGSDVRVAHPRAQLGLAEVRVGVGFPVGPMEIARATLSKNALRRLMLTGQPMDAQRRITTASSTCWMTTRWAALWSRRRCWPTFHPRVCWRQTPNPRDTIDLIEQAMAKGANTPEGGWFTEETVPAMRKMIG